MPIEADVAKLAIVETPESDSPAPADSASPSTQQDPSSEHQEQQSAPLQGADGEEQLIDPSALSSSLDRLLFSYCELLDQYQAVQDRLSCLFSDGFLSLAKANFESRVRFGKDYYHGGMTASNILLLDEKEFTPLYAPETQVEYTHLSLVDAPLPSSPDDEESAEMQEAEKVNASTRTTSTATEETALRRRKAGDDKSGITELEQTDDKKAAASEQLQDSEPPAPPKVRKSKIPLNRDPIRWFGVLVPLSLRKSQTSFTEALTEITNLLTIVNKLGALEATIEHWRAEKA
ncbi:hypothetical protein V1525DRAFT_189882 [Lipomyces kononenkoae]|uniref:Uncharacterized protein n=1 Tax=Lipomyces kononenkoae TaxID=34357 RepID=A0ACC3T0E2_LIPKO